MNRRALSWFAGGTCWENTGWWVTANSNEILFISELNVTYSPEEDLRLRSLWRQVLKYSCTETIGIDKHSDFNPKYPKCSPPKQFKWLKKCYWRGTKFQNSLRLLPGSVSHVPDCSRELREKGGVQKVKVLDKRYDTNVYSLVKSGQIPSSEEVGPPRGNFWKCVFK